MSDYGIINEGFITKTYDIILSEMISKAQEFFGPEIDLRSTSSLYKFLQIIAYQITVQWESMERYWSATFLKTATGLSLDYHGDDFDLLRKTADYSQGIVTFTTDGTIPLTIPEGTTIQTETNYIFETNNDLTILSGSTGSIAITAQESGSLYNVGSNEITVISPTIAHVLSVTNDSPTTGALDLESDEEFRSRLSNLSRTNWTTDSIKSAIEEISGVREVQIYENYPENHQFTVFIAPILAGTLSSGSAYYDQSFFDIIEQAIEEKRPICVYPVIEEANQISIDISAEIELDASYDFDTIYDNIEERITSYITALRIGENVLYHEIVWAIMEEPGVTKSQNITINGSSSDYTIASDEIASFRILIMSSI